MQLLFFVKCFRGWGFTSVDKKNKVPNWRCFQNGLDRMVSTKQENSWYELQCEWNKFIQRTKEHHQTTAHILGPMRKMREPQRLVVESSNWNRVYWAISAWKHLGIHLLDSLKVHRVWLTGSAASCTPHHNRFIFISIILTPRWKKYNSIFAVI